MTISTAIDLTLLQPVLRRYDGRRRDALLPVLHEAQALYGWLPRPVLETISQTLRVPLADIHGVVEFYSMYYNQPTAKRVIRVCEDPACHLANGPAVGATISHRLELHHGQTAADGSVTFEQVPCLGMCELAPVALDADRPAAHLTPGQVDDFLAGRLPAPTAQVYGEPLWMSARMGKVDPGSLADYEAHSGYQGLRQAVTLSPEQLIKFVERVDVVGRGGAMFPTGRKWRMTRLAEGTPHQKHIVVNADESEPGTFKDRCLMEEDPFSLVEAMTVAAYAVGASNGWIFVRGEYPRAYARLSSAVQQAREAGYLGRDILGVQGFDFNVEMRLGAGAYICGEETALFEAIEGKRGFPRIKPPFPVTQGLFGQPTAVNNVETLVAVLAALNVGQETWRSVGTADSPGTRWFCVSGHVACPGLYELPFGLTIGELLDKAGGVKDGRQLQAILMGGAAGKFIGPEQLDLVLTYETLRTAGVPMGSGVVMVFDETADLRQILYQLSRFFAHESCGKCFPCQLGTQRQMEILRCVADGKVKPGDEQILRDVGFAMTQTSLCGLGQTAATAVVSAIDLWPHLVTGVQ